MAAEDVAAQARLRCEAATVLFYVDTLEHLRRGGRIGSASAFLGSALAIKPILELSDGHIRGLEKVRTAVARSSAWKSSRSPLPLPPAPKGWTSPCTTSTPPHGPRIWPVGCGSESTPPVR